MQVRLSRLLCIVVATWISLFGHDRCANAQNEKFLTPEKVSVMPVFLIPRGAAVPSDQGAELVMRHLKWAQDYFRKALAGRDTFEIAKETPEIVKIQKTARQYQAMEAGKAAEQITAELLDHFQVSRFECPWVFCCVLVNKENWPVGGGRPINGGYGRGGGIVLLTSYSFERPTSIQSTMRHELGHAFGLPHVDVYGYDQKSTPSIMAYYQPFKTLSFRKAPETPRFLPEDLRGLALNPLVFSELKFQAARDLPDDYSLFWKVIPLGPMNIPGHPDYEPVFISESEEANAPISVLNSGDILPSVGPGVNYRRKHMWLSRKEADGEVDLTVTFPGDVTLDAMVVHTQHSGKYNQPKQISIESKSGTGFRSLKSVKVGSAEMRIDFPAATAQTWRLRFVVPPNLRVCVRGLEYFSGETQLFPPQVPSGYREEFGIDRGVFAQK